MTVTTRTRRREEHGISRKTIARGMPGNFRRTCGDYARVLLLHCTRGYGCIGTRHSLRPLIARRKHLMQSSDAWRREIAESYLLLFEIHRENENLFREGLAWLTIMSSPVAARPAQRSQLVFRRTPGSPSA